MPYVKVWIDDTECECNGKCAHVTRIRDEVDAALKLLRTGEPGLAEIELGKIVGDVQTAKQIAREKELADLFAKWRGEPGAGPFLDWAHHKRKLSAT